MILRNLKDIESDALSKKRIAALIESVTIVLHTSIPRSDVALVLALIITKCRVTSNDVTKKDSLIKCPIAKPQKF